MRKFTVFNKGPVTWGPKRGGPKILVTFLNRKNRWLLLCRVSCVACPCDRETLPKFTCFSTNETKNVYEFVYFFIEMREALMSLCAWLASIGVNNCYNRNIHYTSASPSFFLAWSIMKWVSRCSSWTISLDSFGSVLVQKRNQNFRSYSFWSSCDRTLSKGKHFHQQIETSVEQ